ncbi:MAG: RHS repeat protein, partial [Lachnospiraceae bacterium]
IYDYNVCGQLMSVVKSGFSHEFFYNDNHKLDEYTFNGRSYLKIHYDLLDNVIAMDYPGEEVHQFFYDEENRLIGYEAQGESCRLLYDERGFIVNVDAPEEFSEEYSYDGIGRITNVKIGNGREVIIQYAFDDLIGYISDDLERSVACKYSLTGFMFSYEEGEQKITCAYDEYGNLIKLDLPGEDVHHMEYDIQGNLLKHYQGEFLLEGCTYDENNRVIKVEDGFGYEESYTWNIWNQPMKIINSNGLVVDIGYNENHFLEEMSVDDFHVTYQYDEDGRLSSISDDAGRYGIYEYDSADRLIQVNTFQAQIELSYDNFSNITLISMADFGYLLQNGYDAYNRHTGGKTLGEAFYRIWYGTGEMNKIEIVGETIGLAHDSGGRVVTLTNYLGKEVEKKFDQYDGLVSIGSGELQDSISYGYDEARRIKWVKDEHGKAIFFSYNGMGIMLGVYHLLSREYSVEELNRGDAEWAQDESSACYIANIDYKKRTVSLKDSLGNISTQEMTSGGILKKSYDAIGDSKEITYDALLRVTGIFEKGSHNEESTFRYEQDRITEATNSNGQVSFDYDLAGRVVGVHYPDGSIAGYEWNQANLCTAMLYPDGSRVEYSYDSFGNLIQTHLPGDTVHYRYDERHRLVKKQSERLSHSFTYHENGKLETLKVQDEEGTVLEIRYAYDEYYNLITEKKILKRGIDPISYGYEYDKRGFLVKTLKNGETWGEYIYDAAGNRIYSKEQGEEASYSYNVENQLLEKKISEHIYTYEYNTRGDMIYEYLDGKVSAQYQYNGLGQLLQVSNENGTVNYRYD